MTAAAPQAAGSQTRQRTPVRLPTPTPGEILRGRVAGLAEDLAVRLEANCNATPELAAAMRVADPHPPTAWRESGSFTGTPSPTTLASTREDKSTCELYLAAIARVRDAYAIQETRLTEAEQEAWNAWSVAGMARRKRLTARLEATQRRIRAFENCAEGKVCVHQFACPGCGQVHDSPPLTCNQRTCPGCVPKLRAQNIAHVLELLEAVDTLRQQKGHRTPRWRFVTLTVRSFDDFLAMRRFMAKAWGKLIRHRFWQRAVGACVACWETTHTAAGWHVHVHALVDAYLPRETLVRAWSKVTGGLGQAVGVHISEPKGDRRSIARELAKYVAKDLGGAGAADSSAWGVAGTAERLAEFLDGSFRWRTLRTYGDCYRAADLLRQVSGKLTCQECMLDFGYLGTVWLDPEGYGALLASRRKKPATGQATPAAP